MSHTSDVQGTLKLHGEGSASARPDVAELDLGVVTEGKTAGGAMQDNALRMTRVIAEMKALGILGDGLQTSGISLMPVYDNDEKSPTRGQIIAYRVEDTLRVRCDIEQAGAALDAGIAAGANIASGVRFALKNEVPLREKALAAAVEDAQRAARVVAKSLGAKLQPPHLIEILSTSGASVTRMSKSLEVGTPVEAGTVSVRASIAVERHYHVE